MSGRSCGFSTAFLDLRRPKLLNNLKFRHRLTKLIHDYLDGQGFLQVETPMLTKSTPEGPGITWCQAGCIRVCFTLCPSHRRFLSNR